MKKIVIVGFVVALLAGSGLYAVQDLSGKEKEHEWLQQFIGEWEMESEMIMAPGQPPLKSKGTESVRAIGGFWIVAEYKGDMPGGIPMTALLTLGYDPQKKKYIGTWVDSMMNYLWTYEGSLDPTGKILTLETEGPNPAAMGKKAKFRDVTEFKSKDQRVFTSSMLGDDGKWSTFLTVNYQRKK